MTDPANAEKAPPVVRAAALRRRRSHDELAGTLIDAPRNAPAGAADPVPALPNVDVSDAAEADPPKVGAAAPAVTAAPVAQPGVPAAGNDLDLTGFEHAAAEPLAQTDIGAHNALEEEADDTTHTIGTMVHGWARRRAVQEGADRGLLHASVAMNAIDEALQDNRLAQYVRSRHELPRPKDSRFPTRSTRRKARVGGRTKTPPRVLHQMSFTTEELAVLDAVMAEVGAATRSELLSVALEAKFADPEQRAQLGLDLDPDAAPPVLLDDLSLIDGGGEHNGRS